MSAAPLPGHVITQDAHDFIAAGTVSMVYALNEDWVIKRSPKPNDSFALTAYNIERRRIGDWARILE